MDTAAFLKSLKVGEWRLSLATHTPTSFLESWDATANPRKNREWQMSLACARQLVKLDGVADTHPTCDDWVHVVAEPVARRGLVAKRDIPPFECVMVPLTTSVACKEAVPKDAVATTTKVLLPSGQKGTVCFLKPKLQFPTEDSQGFVPHFWLVEDAKTAKEANVAPHTAPGSGFHVLRNNKLIKAGERLCKLAKEPGEARGSEACGSGAKPGKRKRSPAKR